MNSPHVLVADDDPVLLDLMVRRVARLGYKADSASDGRAALVMLKRARYDLVVTDIYMPGASGLDVLAEARARDPNLQVIVITAAATLDNAVQALNSGAFSYLTKPFDHLSVFDTAVSRALEYRRLTLDNQRMSEIQRRRGDLLEAEVTERIQQLRKSQRELLDLLALVPEGILVLSAEGKIVLTNPAAERWLAREYRAKERPIQGYIQQLAQGQAKSTQTVTVQDHSLALSAFDLPKQDDKRRLALLIRDETGAEQASPDVRDLANRMKAPLAGLYRMYSSGPSARLVRELALLVTKIEQQETGRLAAGREISPDPSEAPHAARRILPQPAPPAEIVPSRSKLEDSASLPDPASDQTTTADSPVPRPIPTTGTPQSGWDAGAAVSSGSERKRVTAVGSDLLHRGSPLDNGEDPPFGLPQSISVSPERKRTYPDR